MVNSQHRLRKIPSVGALLQDERLKSVIQRLGNEKVASVVRTAVERVREAVHKGDEPASVDQIVNQVVETLQAFQNSTLKPVINATGVIIHTNLGRAVLGEKVLESLSQVAMGYSNLEYDLDKQCRGHRDEHLLSILKFITGAEDATVVNNNAAGLILALSTLAKGKEVIVSRGELVEIGGSFRIPDILAASGAIMVEVGTTNKTHLYDYENAITENTALIFKAHKSNYDIVGFTEEVSVRQLAAFAHQQGVPFLYDIGSGLLRKPDLPMFESEPTVQDALRDGADIVAFSGDKLLGGPQAGILVGRSACISRLRKAPLMRALRVDKLTIAALSCVIRAYLDDATLLATLPFYHVLLQSDEQLYARATALVTAFSAHNIRTDIVQSLGQCGGGTLPNHTIPSYAVRVIASHSSQKARSEFAGRIFKKLHQSPCPVIAVLRQAELLFDVLTLQDRELESIAQQVSFIINEDVHDV
jgi:L-seryl-tRNA(Ser) seleniumtransferase